jgi:hypothetical protein
LRSSARLRLFRFSVSNCTGRSRARVALRHLDLDHLGAEVGEHRRGERPRDEHREVDDPDPLEAGARAQPGLSTGSFKVRRSVNHEEPHALARDGEDVHDAGGEEAGFAAFISNFSSPIGGAARDLMGRSNYAARYRRRPRSWRR